jgi:hypothetical protein
MAQRDGDGLAESLRAIARADAQWKQYLALDAESDWATEAREVCASASSGSISKARSAAARAFGMYSVGTITL